MILPDEGRDASFVNVFEKSRQPSPKKFEMTPRELIDMLSRWKPDEPIETHIHYPSPGKTKPSIILAQGTNSINLSEED